MEFENVLVDIGYDLSPGRVGTCPLATLWLDRDGGRHVGVKRLAVR